MRILSFLAVLVLVPMIVEADGLNSGGGVRGNGEVRVLDAIGMPVAGTGAAGSVRAHAGIIYGISARTPVALTELSVAVVDGGVELAWTASEDAGVAWFRLDRAEVSGLDPGAAVHEPIGPSFPGPGPHRFRDAEVRAGTRYSYLLRARLRTGETEENGPWTVDVPFRGVSVVTRVLPVRPNPFQDAFTLAFELEGESPVRWRLLDLRGALVARGELGLRPAGSHAAAVRTPPGLARGIYFLWIEAGETREVQKLVRLP